MSASRPTSLFQYDNPPQPEKEPLDIELELDGAPEDIVQLVNSIKKVGEQYLYHWKSFPIVLPPPADAIQPAHGTLSSNAEIPYITGGNEDSRSFNINMPGKGARPSQISDLFKTPSFDEMDAVAMDSSGEPHRLNSKQLESITEQGEFEVASLNFPGQMHRWRLSPLLQRGVINAYDTLYADMALALRFLLITGKARLFSHFFSVAQSFTSLITGLTKLLDVVLGIPNLEAVNLEVRLTKERSRYLVAELLPMSSCEESVQALSVFIRRMLRRYDAEKKQDFENDLSHIPVSIPYMFTTPKGFEVDLRLFSKDIMNKVVPVLTEIIERGTRGWFLHFREKLILELRQRKLPDDQIEKEVNEAVMKEYLDRVFSAIRCNPTLQEVGEGIPNLLIEYAQGYVLMHRAVRNMQMKLEANKESLKERLVTEHPILSRIAPWLRDKIRAAEYRFKEECKWSAHEEALSLCTSHHLSQTIYFLHRDLTFMKEREPVLKKELKNDKKPTRTFVWMTLIWRPKNWVVTRYFHGQMEVIPTVLTSTPTSITTPRSDPSQPVFKVSKETVRTSTTRWPLWRWINYCHRTWLCTWNAMFFFGVIMPWHSPLSLRALVCTEPFTPGLELSQVNGTLFPHQGSTTTTVVATLRQLARHVSKQTSHIDSKPDTGFIGKGVTRSLHKMWNYVAKGVFGSLAIVLVFPTVCILTSFLSFIIACTAFIWVPVATLGVQIFMWLIWDLDAPVVQGNRICVLMEALVWHILLQGLLQPTFALLVAVVVCPTIAFSIFAYGVLRFCARMIWDKIVFHLLIKRKGRVPAADSFLVKRISGPGHNTEYYYQIRPELALAAFEARLELDELAAYQAQMEMKILQPQKDFMQFVNTCFYPFSVIIWKAGPYLTLVRESKKLISILKEKLDNRRRGLKLNLISYRSYRSKIKMTNIDLRIAVQQGALMLERFYPSHVLNRLTITEQEFWESKYLGPNDWPGLATYIYSDIFHIDFLAPLDERATCFKIEPSPNADLSRYQELVVGAVGLDLLGPVYTPRTNIQVHPPYLEMGAFGPLFTRSRTSQSNTFQTRKPWKCKHNPYNAEKLLIPLPIPHPIQIAITIYNRDTENPIPVDSELCAFVVQVLEKSVENPVSRYRGGGDNDSCSLSSTLDSVDGSITAPWTDRPWVPPPHVCADLASPEDITLDSDSTRVVGIPLGTTV